MIIKNRPARSGTLIVALLLSGCIWNEATVHRTPGFSEYPASGRFSGLPAPVNLNSAPEARTYRTVLREQAAEGPDFAGHYRLARWGCGSGCLSIAMVDSATGAVVFPETVSPIWFPFVADNEVMDRYGVEYNIQSRLMIIHGIPAAHDQPGDYYYVFQNGRFNQIAAQVWKPVTK